MARLKFQFRPLYLVLFLTTRMAWAAPAHPERLSSLLIRPKSEKELSQIAQHYEIRNDGRGAYEVIVPQADVRRFRQEFPQARIRENDLKDIFRKLDRTQPRWRAGYHTYAQVISQLRNYEKQFPGLTKVIKYGETQQKNPLYALRLARPSGNPPEIMLTAATHGDEIITVEVLLGILDHLLKGYGKDERLTKIVDGHQILFVPVVNPDGFVHHDRYDNGIDPNRSYPWPRRPDATPSSAIGPLIALFSEHRIAASIDFHAFGRFVMYPWGYTRAAVTGSAGSQFREVASMMAKINGYRAGQISRIMYIAPGSSADYYRWKGNTIALGVEMGRSKAPSPSKIAGVLRENLESTLKFIEQF